jgi:hypothetical protein
MKVKSISVNEAMNVKQETEEDGMVNVVMECYNEGYKMPDAVWFNIETQRRRGVLCKCGFC